MAELIELETSRLRLRQWQESDFPAFATMNADADVMKYYPAILSNDESTALAHKFESLITEQGWGFWAVELLDQKQFIGFVGLNKPTYELPFTPCVEIGWRIAKESWGKGYATEAAKAALDMAFERLSLSEVVAFTPVSNKKSQAVMERLHMRDTFANFEHPLVPQDSPLRLHVLYKIEKQDWLKSKST